MLVFLVVLIINLFISVFFKIIFTGIKLNLLNKEVYGYMLSPSSGNSTLEDMKVHFTHVKLEWFGM